MAEKKQHPQPQPPPPDDSSSSEFDPAYTSDSDTEDTDDVPGFLAFLERYGSAGQTFGDQAAALAAHSEYDLVGPSKRLELFAQWQAKAKANLSREAPQETVLGTYPELVKEKWKPGLFYLNFKRQNRDSPAFKDPAFNEKQREGIYREYTRLKKKTAEERAMVPRTNESTVVALDLLS